ncbi:hypothetical protein Trydic_g20106 [Trypoxylus dichotomus]
MSEMITKYQFILLNMDIAEDESVNKMSGKKEAEKINASDNKMLSKQKLKAVGANDVTVSSDEKKFNEERIGSAPILKENKQESHHLTLVIPL